ncbi:FprA family A-type flavoprotein [Alkalimarinus alittae]|uniref:FprA family A-type flavoprotein n=1 Tax=Alkalimarinus alittae TaxID=2961619 RepID=A0ABY6N5S2_9ALTE|nr:FprA family A-type flavoprotein [Alkalimarinus alittae]UZE97441.1 FprA family A-type flavoprotein [Alkalimarinus alittae]
MLATTLYNKSHRWIIFGRDPGKPEKIIDTNQVLITSGEHSILLDPGGIELFAPMLAATLKYVPIDHITHIFASHQDPDIISSLGLWDQVVPNAKLHCPWLWEGFVRHFGMNNIEYTPIKDQGGTIKVGNIELQFIPAHYLHSSGNFNVYDPVAKILFSGDIGAALEAPDAPFEIEDFNEQIDKMQLFHQRWMPSNRAKQDWIRRIRKLDIDIMIPQHGRIFRGENVGKFLDWFEALEVGVAIQ